MSKTILCVSMAALLLVGCGATLSQAGRQPETTGLLDDATRPNVIFVIADDLNSDLGCYGHKEVQTPNLDKLAGEGVRFDRAYCQFALCNPSRTSLLTGLTPATTGVQKNNVRPEGLTWMPDYFKRAGYRTGVFGKVTHGKFSDVMTADDYQSADEIGGIDYAPLCPDTIACGPNIKDKQDVDAKIARRAIRFLRKAEGPFFLAVGFTKPHSPFYAPRKYFARYNADDIPLSLPIGDDGMTNEERRRAKLAYYACLSFLDAQLGLILDALDELGLRKNTVIIFTSDHGYLLGEHGIWDKHNLYDQTARVPLIVRAPGIPAGVAQGIVELTDLLPTLADLCGLETGSLEGLSFAALLNNPERSWKLAAFTESIKAKKRSVAVHTERYSYIEEEVDTFLFDRLTDPLEERSLSDPALQAQMKAILTAGWREARPK